MRIKFSHFMHGVFASVLAFSLFSCGSTVMTVSSSSAGATETPASAYVHAKTSYKVACVGESLTYGHSWHDESYPVYLQSYLDSAYEDVSYEVKNCGVNGISVTGYGGSWNSPDNSYLRQEVYSEVVSFVPDIIALMLGSNDANNWEAAASSFAAEYLKLIESFRRDISPDVSIIIMTSPPTEENNSFSIPGDIIVNEIDPIQRKTAEDEGYPLLDVAEAFDSYADGLSSLLREDGVHLSVAGAQYVASMVGEAVCALEN